MEEGILYPALEQFNLLAPIQAEVLWEKKRIGKNVVDAELYLRNGDQGVQCYAEIKHKIVPAQINQLKEQLVLQKPCILIADYITTQAKEILRDQNIGYIDTLGNAYLNFDGLFVYIETNKTNRQKITVGNRALNKTGLKVVYQFLIHPEYLNEPYRFIATQAGVAIDTVGKVIKGLLQDRYIMQRDAKTYEFNDRQKLFEDWAIAYNQVLKPKLKQRTYKCIIPNWKTLELPEGTFLGGALAAERLTDYLIAEKATLFTTLPFNAVAKELKLIPDPDGDITLMEAFWEEENHTELEPFCIYVNLLGEANPRYLETANIIFEKYVKAQL